MCPFCDIIIPKEGGIMSRFINSIKRRYGKAAQWVVDKAMGSGLMQEELTAEGERYVTPGMPELARQAAAEGCVLLKNDGLLPFDPEEEIAVFGRCQMDWFHVGYGSGGDVHAPYYVNLVDGLRNAGAKLNLDMLVSYMDWTSHEDHRADHGWWGHWPMSHPEMYVSTEAAEKAAETASAALVVIGRAAGEDRENTLTNGSYYLTDEEQALLDTVTSAFSKTAVLLNIGSIMDMSWIPEYGEKISAVMIAWQGGMESGNAAADVLLGKQSPSGRLPDSIALRWDDYPSSANFGGKLYNDYAEGIYVGYRHFDKYANDRVLYPFGYGLSYTCFDVESLSFEHRIDAEAGDGSALKSDSDDAVSVRVRVRNTGKTAGKDVVQLWCCPPEGGLDKPVRVLAGFGKTAELAPGEAQEIDLSCSLKSLSSYDESLSAFVMEPGIYEFFVTDGTSLDNGGLSFVGCGSVALERELITEQCEPVLTNDVELKKRILERLPEEIKSQAAGELSLESVAEGKLSLDEFTGGLSDEELEALTRGHGMMGSSLGVAGNAGAFGGIIPSLREKGVMPLITSDGPSGLRLRRYCSLLPSGTALASTWDTAVVERLYGKTGEEMTHYGVDILLAPGMNIHRNPLGGRNFEYFSEDPLLTGKMAAAVIRGVQSQGHAACPKHFACNNQETRRNKHDSRVSERALREIYLRCFEIAVKESNPLTIMTSYNKINGVWSHYNYDLVTTVLRKEWGYSGTVITDWWMQKSKSPEFPLLRNNAYRVRAQVDVLMPGDFGHLAKKYKADSSLRKTLGLEGGITKGELQRTAKNVLRLVLRLKYRR